MGSRQLFPVVYQHGGLRLIGPACDNGIGVAGECEEMNVNVKIVLTKEIKDGKTGKTSSKRRTG